VPEVGLRFNVVLIFAVFTIVSHNGENPLNCPAASSTLVGSKLTSQAIQEIGAHKKIIAARKAEKCTALEVAHTNKKSAQSCLFGAALCVIGSAS